MTALSGISRGNRKPNADEQFFLAHADRQCRIRLPDGNECDGEFWTLGPYDRNRRRIILWKIPKGRVGAGKILKIPFLAFADETIEDDDKTLLPILDQIMKDAAIKQGVPRR